MWNEPTRKDLARIPGLYETEKVPPRDKIIHEHFFIFGSDWYAVEYSPTDRLYFGYAILNNDLQNSEWGYFSFDELRSINVSDIEVDRDLHWKPTKARNVDKIREAEGWQGRS